MFWGSKIHDGNVERRVPVHAIGPPGTMPKTLMLKGMKSGLELLKVHSIDSIEN